MGWPFTSSFFVSLTKNILITSVGIQGFEPSALKISTAIEAALKVTFLSASNYRFLAKVEHYNDRKKLINVDEGPSVKFVSAIIYAFSKKKLG